MKIGTDIIQIARIENALERFGDKFKQRYLCDDEIAMAKSIESLAGLWAAKEAISKALGCGICKELSFHDIIIMKNGRGAPYFKLTEDAQKRHHLQGSSLSISHDGGFSIAVVALTTQ